MTEEEFAAQVTTRPILGRAVSFEQWLQEQGIPAAELVGDAEVATFIGGVVFPRLRSGAQRGKDEALRRRVARSEELRAQYEREVPEVVVGNRPLDPGNGADQAYVRAQFRRLKAREAGQ